MKVAMIDCSDIPHYEREARGQHEKLLKLLLSEHDAVVEVFPHPEPTRHIQVNAVIRFNPRIKNLASNMVTLLHVELGVGVSALPRTNPPAFGIDGDAQDTYSKLKKLGLGAITQQV